MQTLLFRRWKYLVTSLLILAALVISSLPPKLAGATSSVPIGVYNGPGKVAALNDFGNWLGSPVVYATDYVDYKNGWSTDFNPTWLIGPWGQWVNQATNRKLVLGLPMLENSNYGQFDQGAAGAFDTYFINLSQKMVSNGLGSSVIRLGYEANCDTIGPWQATDNPTGYIKHFRHIVQIMKSVPGTNFKFDWTVCNGLQNGHVLNSFASFYPGDDVVDIIGMDQYDVKWMDTMVTHEQRWQYNVSRYMGLQDHQNFALSHGKPVSFPEWGLYKPGDSFAGGGDNPYFIDSMINWIEANNTVYQSYFNLNWGGGVLADFPNGQARFKARLGQATPTLDTTAPSVSMSAPTASAAISGTTNINVSATDNVGVAKVELYIDGILKGSDLTAPYSFTWDTKTVSNGNHILFSKAYDAAGNSTQSTSVTVSINNTFILPSSTDTTAPVVTLSSPVGGVTTLSQVAVISSATDNMGIKKMEMYLDGKYKQTYYASSLTYSWGVKRGSHTVTIKAYDTAGNIGQASATISKF
jgi:hypothetical protein